MDLSTIPGVVAETFAAGLPVLAVQLAAVLALHALGVFLNKRITPFDEDAMIASGNAAAGLVLGGGKLALAIPLAATMANQSSIGGILIWGVVALVIQISVLAVLLRRRATVVGITQGNVATALAMVGTMLAFAFINAGAMLG